MIKAIASSENRRVHIIDIIDTYLDTPMEGDVCMPLNSNVTTTCLSLDLNYKDQMLLDESCTIKLDRVSYECTSSCRL
jgi:hypothetical protein